MSCRPDFAVLLLLGLFQGQGQGRARAWPAHPARHSARSFWYTAGTTGSAARSHSVLAYLALKCAGVLAELHVYAKAAHDFGVRPSHRPYSAWTDAWAAWLRQQGLLLR